LRVQNRCGRGFPASAELTVHCCTAGRQPDCVTINAKIEDLQRESIEGKELRGKLADCCPFLLTRCVLHISEMHIAKANLNAKLNAFECL